ncbi:hypothetical protein [Rubrivivax sp. A210]|uniref:hypothetical protein n=1 Tax=Rubrivivax sp. A210 TaxID=2772301 RepID=UPI0019182A25|nr:hypothetical protein [Rubrivivax sp. A210]
MSTGLTVFWRSVLLAACALLLAGCGTLNSARMLAPSLSGMEEWRPGLFVEPAMSAAQRQALEQQIALGRAQVERFFGAIVTAPYFVACISFDCARRFGSYGERAAAFGDSAIRLSPDGLQAALVAHEWSHAELYRRVGGWWRISAIPRWFDEGVAVVLADEARHSPANWQEIQRRGLSTPTLDELVTRRDWTEAVRRYGETRAEDPDNLRRVYSTAGHELRGWLACAGREGLAGLLAGVDQGQAFDALYARLGCGGPGRISPAR